MAPSVNRALGTSSAALSSGPDGRKEHLELTVLIRDKTYA